jgi:hypothetical protein
VTPKQNTNAATSLKQNSVTVETLESRMCLSAAAGAVVTPMMQYAVRAEMRELAHVEYHAEQVFAYHAATTEGFRGAEFHDRDVRPHMVGGDFQHDAPAAPVGGFIANFGGGMVKMIIIHLGGDAQLPAMPPSYGQNGDTSGGPTINPGYSGEPVGEPVSSPPPLVQPVVGKPTDTPVSQPSIDQPGTTPAQQQQHRHATSSVELAPTSTTSTTNTTIQTPLMLDARSLKSNVPVASNAHVAAAVLSSDVPSAEGGFTAAKFASALKALTPANFADLSVARLAGAEQSTFLHDFSAVPSQAAAKVEGVLADAVAGATAARPTFFEFTHLGSPFALLSDSMANFVEDSASLPMAVAKTPRSGPWTLTATVVAADVLLLTYMYRRSQQNRRRHQLAHAYAYSPFAS